MSCQLLKGILPSGSLLHICECFSQTSITKSPYVAQFGRTTGTSCVFGGSASSRPTAQNACNNACRRLHADMHSVECCELPTAPCAPSHAAHASLQAANPSHAKSFKVAAPATQGRLEDHIARQRKRRPAGPRWFDLEVTSSDAMAGQISHVRHAVGGLAGRLGTGLTKWWWLTGLGPGTSHSLFASARLGN